MSDGHLVFTATMEHNAVGSQPNGLHGLRLTQIVGIPKIQVKRQKSQQNQQNQLAQLHQRLQWKIYLQSQRNRRT